MMFLFDFFFILYDNWLYSIINRIISGILNLYGLVISILEDERDIYVGKKMVI